MSQSNPKRDPAALSSEPHRVYSRPIIRDGRHYHGAEGPMYSEHHDGAEIVAMTRQPLLDGARALKAMDQPEIKKCDAERGVQILLWPIRAGWTDEDRPRC